MMADPDRAIIREIVSFGQAMRELAKRDEPARGLALVRLIALTGFRLNEVQGLQRLWFDGGNRACLFPDTKSDAGEEGPA